MSRDEINRRFGRLLNRRRSDAGFTQGNLGRALGLSRTSITNIERGRQPVSLPTLYAIAGVLHLEVVDLLPAAEGLRADGKLRLPGAAERDLGKLSTKQVEWLKTIVQPSPAKGGTSAGNRKDSGKGRAAAQQE